MHQACIAEGLLVQPITSRGERASLIPDAIQPTPSPNVAKCTGNRDSSPTDAGEHFHWSTTRGVFTTERCNRNTSSEEEEAAGRLMEVGGNGYRCRVLAGGGRRHTGVTPGEHHRERESSTPRRGVDRAAAAAAVYSRVATVDTEICGGARGATPFGGGVAALRLVSTTGVLELPSATPQRRPGGVSCRQS
jgi:hypothetical protein